MDSYIQLSRSVDAIQIPSGQTVPLPAGTTVTITQSLGGTFTVHASLGGLYRINSADADALGMEPESKTSACEGTFSEENLWSALKKVYDPEIPVNIVDLGLIYDLKAQPLENSDNHKVVVQMTLTAPGCGMGPALAADAQHRLLSQPGVAEADVQLVWDPPWNPERISEAGKRKLGID